MTAAAPAGRLITECQRSTVPGVPRGRVERLRCTAAPWGTLRPSTDRESVPGARGAFRRRLSSSPGGLVMRCKYMTIMMGMFCATRR